jgi:diadenosine tetraphosphate (Ap4A) HIT family hydrolase
VFHYRTTKKKYAGYPKPATCPFCDRKMAYEKIAETTHAFIAPNRVFYDLWELRTVTDHLLVIPKRHVSSLSELTPTERIDIMNVIADYEGGGYNVYARAANSPQKSVGHQHTHLIKTETHQGRLMLYLKKPYLLIRL